MLNRDVRQFGKKFMFDGDEETCWNSDQVEVVYYDYKPTGDLLTSALNGVGL